MSRTEPSEGTGSPLGAPASSEDRPVTSMASQRQQPPPPDILVLVRPPPSISTHPLNLQIQLLVPSASRGGAGARPASVASSAAGRSMDAVAGASVSRSSLDGEGLRRVQSGLSTRSSSGRSRSGSVTSGVSESGESTTSSVGGGRRRKITPLLDFSYHSLAPTVVTDAGTDQRVARFQKRGIELTGLGIFDPVELSTVSSPFLFAPTSSARPSTDSARYNAPITPKGGVALQTQPGSGGMFGRFKKLSFASPASSGSSFSPPSSSSNISQSPSFLASLSASTSITPDTPLPNALPLIRTVSNPSSAPSLSPPLSPASRRDDEGYAFVPRRWIREDLASAASTPKGLQGGMRIEWKRPERRRRSKASIMSGESAVAGRTRSGTVTSAGGAGRTRIGGAVADAGESPPLSSAGEEDDDGDSDPEDSDRPWVCTLVYPLSSAASSSADNDESSLSPTSSPSDARLSLSTTRSTSPSGAGASSRRPPTLRRLHLAHLRPAPHHPHLVSTLLLPPLLPSIPLGSFSPSAGLVGGSLGAEELRDLAMCTALWVAVREGLGGLGGEEKVRESGGRTSLGVKVGLGGGGGSGGKGAAEGGKRKRFGLFGR